MMKYALFFAITLQTTFSFAQTQSKKFTFRLGTEYELPKRSEDLSFVGNEDDGIVNLSLKSDELSITRFDPASLRRTSEKTITLPELTKNFNSETVAEFDNKYFWIHSDWDKSAEREYLYYDNIDVKSGKISVSNKKMLESSKMAGIPTRAGRGWYSVKLAGKYDFAYDAEHTKMLVSYRLSPDERNDKKNYDKLGMYVFDDNMNKIWGGEFTMPYTEAIMDNSDFSIDSKGNAYLLAKVYDSDKRKEVDKETGKAGYHYEILKFSKDSKKVINATITVGDYFIKETSLVENSLHEMVVACTYSKKARSNGTDGIFLAILDPGGKITKFKNGYYEFPIEDLEKFESARTKKKMEKKDDYEAPNLRVRNVVVEGDGSVFIACEEYSMVATTHTTTSGMMSSGSTTYTYFYQDIIAAKINALGNFEWLRKIPKQQRGYNGTGTMSFKLIMDAQGYYFLFLDNKKNMELREDEAPKYHIDGFGGQVVVASIDRSGKMSKDLIFDTREEDIMIFPSLFTNITGNQYIGRANLKKGIYKPLMITVN